jgi:steroid Delta-isomerase
MGIETTPGRVGEHVAAFNAAVQSGDWESFADRFAPDATMEFIGVPAGPFLGRAEIARAYAEQPPTDTMTVGGVDSAGAADTVRFTWAAGGNGTMRLDWQGPLVASLQVAFDD